MKIYVPIGLVLCLMIFADPATVTMHCPSIFSANDTANEVSCDVNTVEVGKAQCIPPPVVVSFVIKKGGFNVDPLCAVDISSPGHCDGGQRKSGCWCSGVDGNIKSFRFLYMGDREHAGEKLTCKVCGFERGGIPISEDLGNCEEVTFAPEPETTPLTTENVGTGNPKSSLLGVMLAVAASLLLKT